MPQLDAGIGCGGLGFFAACGAQALASLMDFETELGFYMVSFILICFRLPRLKITASLWQTNAPAAKISRLAPAIAHRAPARYQDVSFFFFFWKKASIGGGRAETERCTDSVSLIVIHQALHAAPSTPNAHTHGSSCRFDKAGKEGVMELYGSGQSCQYIERFTTLLSKGLGLLVATKHRGQRMCDSRGGGWRTGKVLLRHGGRQQTGLMAHALLAL